MLGHVADAERILSDIDWRGAPARLVALRELVAAELALRRIEPGRARGALERAAKAAAQAQIPALSREIEHAARALTAPAARLMSAGSVQLVDHLHRPPDWQHHQDARLGPLRHRSHLARRRALARHVGRRGKRTTPHRPRLRRGPRPPDHARGQRRLWARIRRGRHLLLRRRTQRQSARREAPAARLTLNSRGGATLGPGAQRPAGAAFGSGSRDGSRGAVDTSPRELGPGGPWRGARPRSPRASRSTRTVRSIPRPTCATPSSASRPRTSKRTAPFSRCSASSKAASAGTDSRRGGPRGRRHAAGPRSRERRSQR
jgi:hypothetical protein